MDPDNRWKHYSNPRSSHQTDNQPNEFLYFELKHNDRRKEEEMRKQEERRKQVEIAEMITTEKFMQAQFMGQQQQLVANLMKPANSIPIAIPQGFIPPCTVSPFLLAPSNNIAAQTNQLAASEWLKWCMKFAQTPPISSAAPGQNQTGRNPLVEQKDFNNTSMFLTAYGNYPHNQISSSVVTRLPHSSTLPLDSKPSISYLTPSSSTTMVTHIPHHGRENVFPFKFHQNQQQPRIDSAQEPMKSSRSVIQRCLYKMCSQCRKNGQTLEKVLLPCSPAQREEIMARCTLTMVPDICTICSVKLCIRLFCVDKFGLLQKGLQDDKRYVGVFWDIENCRVPRNKSGIDVAVNIRKKFFNSKSLEEKEFVVACNANQVPATLLKDLASAGVTTLHVNSGPNKKNAADYELSKSINQFMHINKNAPTMVILITGDGDFVSDVLSLNCHSDCQIFLVHPLNWCRKMGRLVNNTFSYEDILNDTPTRPDPGIRQEFPVFNPSLTNMNIGHWSKLNRQTEAILKAYETM